MKKWTEEEIEWLKENYPYRQFNEMEQHLQRSHQAITKMAIRLKIKRDELVYKNFTKEQDEWLRKFYYEASWEELLKKFPNLSKTQIEARAKYLKIKRKPTFYKFSKEEDEILKRYFGKISTKEVSLLLDGRDEKAIYHRARKLGLEAYKIWTKEKDEFLINNYDKLRIRDLMKALGLNSNTPIYNRMRELGLQNCGIGRIWNDGDDRFLIDNYNLLTNKDIASILKRTEIAIKSRASNLGIKKEINVETNYSDIRKFLRANNEGWRNEIIKICGGKCIFTESENFVVHHLYANHLITSEAIEKFGVGFDIDVTNENRKQRKEFKDLYLKIEWSYPAICIREDIHNKFHSIYGLGNNTPEQFIEFVSNFFPEKLETLLKYMKKTIKITN